MLDEDELYTKVYFFLFEIVWMSKYASQDFIELISKESICSKVTSECVVVGKDLEWRHNHTKSCRYRKVLYNFVVHNFFYLKSF
jgi:hypothetical protein